MEVTPRTEKSNGATSYPASGRKGSIKLPRQLSTCSPHWLASATCARAGMSSVTPCPGPSSHASHYHKGRACAAAGHVGRCIGHIGGYGEDAWAGGLSNCRLACTLGAQACANESAWPTQIECQQVVDKVSQGARRGHRQARLQRLTCCSRPLVRFISCSCRSPRLSEPQLS